MICPKCGEAIPEENVFCPHCNADLTNEAEEQSVVYASQKEFEVLEKIEPKPKKKIPKIVFVIIAITTCIILAVIIANGLGKANLKKALIKEWYDVDGSILKVLDIKEDKMEYRLETVYYLLNPSLGTYEWKPVSGNRIKIKRYNDQYETFTVELNDEKNILKISPAITSSADSETWYYID